MPMSVSCASFVYFCYFFAHQYLIRYACPLVISCCYVILAGNGSTLLPLPHRVVL